MTKTIMKYDHNNTEQTGCRLLCFRSLSYLLHTQLNFNSANANPAISSWNHTNVPKFNQNQRARYPIASAFVLIYLHVTFTRVYGEAQGDKVPHRARK